MAKFCSENRVRLLCYGTLLGGFLSERFLGTERLKKLETSSQKKYMRMIDVWGGWDNFQGLLNACNDIAIKHNASIANVAVRWVLDQPSVGAAIVGTRLGYTDHTSSNRKTFGLKLDSEDREKLIQAQSRGNDLMKVIGDCGDEYRI
eukprot:CAMPEP_0171469310 /NCGR_PEP_ID=MMETSP0945-20130129/11206_1 /TAXON_ID=109269 /ORGANISM="Vaucheria litorea, Strain CCMP2940" /LENGTH=146 /DNA_ID=CAMNT_0011998425 /DNA_START=659 /DNA_END=1099 /DNA_ORIENTATION=+